MVAYLSPPCRPRRAPPMPTSEATGAFGDLERNATERAVTIGADTRRGNTAAVGAIRMHCQAFGVLASAACVARVPSPLCSSSDGPVATLPPLAHSPCSPLSPYPCAPTDRARNGHRPPLRRNCEAVTNMATRAGRYGRGIATHVLPPTAAPRRAAPRRDHRVETSPPLPPAFSRRVAQSST